MELLAYSTLMALGLVLIRQVYRDITGIIRFKYTITYGVLMVGFVLLCIWALAYLSYTA